MSLASGQIRQSGLNAFFITLYDKGVHTGLIIKLFITRWYLESILSFTTIAQWDSYDKH